MIELTNELDQRTFLRNLHLIIFGKEWPEPPEDIKASVLYRLVSATEEERKQAMQRIR